MIYHFEGHFRCPGIFCGEGVPLFADCRYSERADYMDVTISFLWKYFVHSAQRGAVFNKPPCTLYDELDVEEGQLADKHTLMTKGGFAIESDPEGRKER